jgi:hypothetical protein
MTTTTERTLFDLVREDANDYTEALDQYFTQSEVTDPDLSCLIEKLQNAYPDSYYTQEYTIGSGQYLRLEIYSDTKEIRRAFLVRTDFPEKEEWQFSDKTADRLGQLLGIGEY